MHIRHSERPKIRRDGFGATLTDTGKKAAYEFGSLLSRNRSYKLYHSDSKRVIETAEEIHKGLKSINADTHIEGIFHNSHHDQEKLRDYLRRDAVTDGEENARPFFINWASGH
jgi:broad specificity phosphatase PhoE